jgi:hypothetical protein
MILLPQPKNLPPEMTTTHLKTKDDHLSTTHRTQPHRQKQRSGGIGSVGSSKNCGPTAFFSSSGFSRRFTYCTQSPVMLGCAKGRAEMSGITSVIRYFLIFKVDQEVHSEVFFENHRKSMGDLTSQFCRSDRLNLVLPGKISQKTVESVPPTPSHESRHHVC